MTVRSYKPAEQRREEIVDATLAILADEGLHAWTTAALAGRVGVSEAALFRHFDSKEAILAAALRRQAAELRGRIEAHEPEESTGWERAEGLARAVLAYLEETEGGPLLILLGHAARIRPAMREEVERTAGIFRCRLVELLQGARGAEGGHGADGGREEADAAPFADLIIAVVQSSCLRWSVAGREGSLLGRAEPLLARLGAAAAGS